MLSDDRHEFVGVRQITGRYSLWKKNIYNMLESIYAHLQIYNHTREQIDNQNLIHNRLNPNTIWTDCLKEYCHPYKLNLQHIWLVAE